MSDSRLLGFIKDPRPILTKYPLGGVELASQIRGYASSSYSAMMAIKKISTLASLDQKRAIGQGMAAAAIACLARDAEISKEIADVVRSIGDIDIIKTFITSTDDDPKPLTTTNTEAAVEPVKKNSLGYDKTVPLQSTLVPQIPLSDSGKSP